MESALSGLLIPVHPLVKKMSPLARKHVTFHPHHRQRKRDDLDLVREILSGSVESWHVFVDRYSGLILSVVRQQLFAEDNDEIQTVYVDVLKDLYDEKLRGYKGKAALATWLVLVARGKAVDYIRKKRGRRQLPRGYEKLTSPDRRVFQLHFVEGLDFESVLQTLNWDGGGYTVEDVVASVGQIVENVDGRHLKRLEYERDARKRGVNPSAILEYLYAAEVEVRGDGASRSPDQILEDGELQRAMARLEALKERLPLEDQELLALRFDRGWTARQISEKLKMGGQRKVYTALDRAINRLRILFFGGEPRDRTSAGNISAGN
jgi:RNA polymerase sigma factor (sigma-70 family)